MRSVVVLTVLAVAPACGSSPRGSDATPAAAPWIGVVEGFYGTPYGLSERRAALVQAAARGLDTWVYAPKQDELHRDRWREPYPEDFLDHFEDLATAAPSMRFVYALAPGLDFGAEKDDLETLLGKLSAIHARGVRDFCILFDDIATGNAGAEPSVQVEVLSRAFDHLRSRDEEATLCFVPNYYFGTPDELEAGMSPFAPLQPHPATAYYDAYRSLPEAIAVMWTGRRVFADVLTAADTAAFREWVGRPVLIWDNYPVNDTVFANELFLGPYTGREAGVLEHAGVLVNPMRQPAATRLPLATFAEWARDGDGYDSEAALARAVVDAGGATPDALRLLVSQFAGHPAIGDGREAVELATKLAAFLAAPAGTARDDLDGMLADLEGVPSQLDLAPDLAAELAEPAEKLARLARAARLGVDAYAAARAGQSSDLSAFEAAVATANELPWLVGANTALPPVLAASLAEHEPVRADVFGDFFAAVREAAR